jgi:hypothetical protein
MQNKMNRFLYIDVDTAGGWPQEEKKPIVKFGTTDAPGKTPADRCHENQQALSNRWGIEATLRVALVAEGPVTAIEGEVRERTSSWRPKAFGPGTEWRRACPRQLARIVILIARDRLGPPGGLAPVEVSSTESRGARKFSMLGAEIHCKPMLTGASPNPEQRSLLEPRPDLGPKHSGLYRGEISSSLGQSSKVLRERNRFAEQRVLRDGGPAQRGPGEEEISFGAGLSFRVGPMMETLLEESWSHSGYRSRSAYCRAVGTGRDRRGPITAKGGLFLHWLRSHLGEVGGPEVWTELEEIAEKFFEGAGPREALRLVRRHLMAVEGGAIPDLRSPSSLESSSRWPALLKHARRVERETRETLSGQRHLSGGSTVSARISEERKRLIQENASCSDYKNPSAFLRRVVLGWDRDQAILAQCAVATCWMESFFGNAISQEDWHKLDRLMHRRFEIFLIGSSGTDPESALRQAEEHLLSTSVETVAEEIEIGY